jgi:hypothetical protein
MTLIAAAIAFGPQRDGTMTSIAAISEAGPQGSQVFKLIGLLDHGKTKDSSSIKQLFPTYP